MIEERDELPNVPSEFSGISSTTIANTWVHAHRPAPFTAERSPRPKNLMTETGSSFLSVMK